jgi:predicted CopG family antitoxin
MKTISLREETYNHLIALKENNESFSDLIDDLLKTKRNDFRKYFGALKGNKVLDEISEFSKISRQQARQRR